MNAFEIWFAWALKNDIFPSYNSDTEYIARDAWDAARKYEKWHNEISWATYPEPPEWMDWRKE